MGHFMPCPNQDVKAFPPRLHKTVAIGVVTASVCFLMKQKHDFRDFHWSRIRHWRLRTLFSSATQDLGDCARSNSLILRARKSDRPPGGQTDD